MHYHKILRYILSAISVDAYTRTIGKKNVHGQGLGHSEKGFSDLMQILLYL